MTPAIFARGHQEAVAGVETVTPNTVATELPAGVVPG